MRINILTIGGYKESWFKECEAEYKKRINPYCNLNYTEIRPVKLPDNPSEKQIEQTLSKEADMLLSQIAGNSKTEFLRQAARRYIIALCVEGKQLSSEEFSALLSNISAAGKEIVIIIGSSHGLSRRIKEDSDFMLSISGMTLPHQLARVVLTEQIYRAITIQKGLKYHK